MAILIHNGQVVTVDRQRRIIVDGAVLVEGDRIADVGKSDELAAANPLAEHIDAGGGIVMPGLVDAHVHLTQGVMRGVGADLSQQDWIRLRLRPCEAALSSDEAAAGVELCLLEHLRSGATTVADSLTPPAFAEQAAALALASGLRVALSPVYSGPTDGARIEQLHERLHGQAGRLQVFVGLRPLAAVSHDVASEGGALARRLGTRMSWHFQPGAADREALAALAGRLGLLWPGALLGHCVDIGIDDIPALAGAQVVVLSTTNARLGMKICPVPELLAAGVNVALGSDGDNSRDLFQVMSGAAETAKSRLRDGTALPVESVIEMATIGGARALGLEAEIGSLERGKKADIIVIEASGPWLHPIHNPLASIVYCATGRDVATVMVDGRLLLRDRKPLLADENRIIAAAAASASSLVRRAGLAEVPRPAWPMA